MEQIILNVPDGYRQRLIDSFVNVYAYRNFDADGNPNIENSQAHFKRRVRDWMIEILKQGETMSARVAANNQTEQEFNIL